MAKGFGDAFDDFTDDFIDANSRIMRAATIAMVDGFIKGSPVMDGSFRANWFVTGPKPSVRFTTASDTQGSSTLNTAIMDTMKVSDWTLFNITNNSPQGKVIEYGGYPSPVSMGTLMRDGTYQIRSDGGYSKQAPSGVVRVNAERVKSNFDKLAKTEYAKMPKKYD